MPLITIVDYGMGNLHSVRRKLERIGAQVVVTSDPAAVAAAEKLVLPGVGHFGRAMENLRTLGLLDALGEAVHVRKTPLLGICLGMQLLAARSEEGDVEGLGWIDATVARFRVADTVRFKVPHIGWNSVAVTRENPLFRGIPANAEFYFVHSFHLVCADERLASGRTEYAYPFASVVQKEHVFGVQFHPEKSHDAGELLLTNFVAV